MDTDLDMDFPAVEAFRGRDGAVRVIGHRGARGDMPENTMAGFEHVLEAGVDLLEFDVVLTADMVPVIAHDLRLHKPTFRGPDGRFLRGDQPRVAELTFAELGKYDVGGVDPGSDYGRQFPDQARVPGARIPRLAELLELVAGPEHPGAHLMLEFKTDPESAREAGHRAAFAKTVIDEVRRWGLADRTLLHSFDFELLAECRRQAPEMPASYLTRLDRSGIDAGGGGRIPDMVPDMVWEAGGAVWCPFFGDIDAAGLARAREIGLCVAVWTVNGEADIDRMAALGVDAIVTDYPGRVRERLAERGIRC